jgi:hypothetical protein
MYVADNLLYKLLTQLPSFSAKRQNILNKTLTDRFPLSVHDFNN